MNLCPLSATDCWTMDIFLTINLSHHHNKIFSFCQHYVTACATVHILFYLIV